MSCYYNRSWLLFIMEPNKQYAHEDGFHPTDKKKRGRECGHVGPLLRCRWECEMVQLLWETVWWFLQRLNLRATLLPSKFLSQYRPSRQRNTCSQKIMSQMFRVANVWKQPNCPSADEWIRELWYILAVDSPAMKGGREVLMELQHRGALETCRSLKKPDTKGHAYDFFSQEMSRGGKPIETERRFVVA